MLILGIDPGKKGALALLDVSELSVECHDMPDTTQALHALLSGLPPVRLCCVEKPFYPPHVGIGTISKMAEAYGTLRGALQWLDIPTFETRPAEWKAALNLNSSKSASREKASQFFPGYAEQWQRVKDDGRAEAALIAWYGQRWAK
jgi:hypothetical protein